MKIYITAGHNINEKGAGTGCFYTAFQDYCLDDGTEIKKGQTISEAHEAIKIRDLLVTKLKQSKPTLQVFKDNNTDTLSKVINWLSLNKTSQDISIEIHFDSFPNQEANGCTAFVRDHYAVKAFHLGNLITESLEKEGIFRNRRCKFASESQHSRLGILTKPKGINVLLELGFLSNPKDQKSYFENKNKIVDLLCENILKLS